MATYTITNTKSLVSSALANRVVQSDSVAVGTALATNDVVNLCRIPAGTAVDRVVIKNPDLDTGTALVFKLGFATIDGSTPTGVNAMSSPDAAVAAAGQTTWQAAATTTYEIFPPYLVTVDCYLQAVVGTGGSTNTGTIYAKVEGEGYGVR